MSSKMTKLMLFLSSYFPLFIIIAITQRKNWGYYFLTPAIIGFSAIIWLASWLAWANKKSPEELSISKAKSKDPEVVAYIISYMLPIAGSKFSDFDGAAIVVIFFILIMILNMNSNLVYINPVLNFIGYHLFEVELESGNDILLITRREQLLNGQKVNGKRVASSIFLGDI